jgi:hypothetical protein
MPGFDDRLKRDLERMAEPADPAGAFEHVMERKTRRRILRKAQVVGLVVVVLAGTIGGTFALSRVFHGSGTIAPGGSPTSTEPSATAPSPSPSPTPSPSDICKSSLTVVNGDFDGDGLTDTATVGPAECLPPAPPPAEGTTDYSVNVAYGDGRDATWPIMGCQSVCQGLGVADLNGDAIDELFVVVDEGSSAGFLSSYELQTGETARGEATTVALPGAPGFPTDQPAVFEYGGSVTHQGYVTCQNSDPGGQQLIATTVELNKEQTEWLAHETVFTFAVVQGDGVPVPKFTVVSTRDYTAKFDPSGQTVFQPTGTQCLSSDLGATSPTPSPSPTAVVINPGKYNDPILFDPPGDAQPQLTSAEALAIFKAADPEFNPQQEELTAHLGFYTAAVGDGTYRFKHRLAWGYSVHWCAVYQHPVSPGTVVPCTFWLFLDANTGEMLEGTWQQGT